MAGPADSSVGARTKRWVRRHDRLLLAVTAGLLVGLPLITASAYGYHLVGLALMIGAVLSVAGYLERRWAPSKRQASAGVYSVWREWLPPLLLVGVAAALLWPLLLGMMPQSQDHPVHLTRAWHFVTHMLARGRLSGWSDLWFAGWPAGEDYPPGADYWVSTFYLGTFGLLGWQASYALAFLAMYAAAACSIYAFGRVYFGRWAGFIAGLLFLLDRGFYREGGWSYTVWWGVWPQVLSTAFLFLSFAAINRVITHDRSRHIAVAALCVGLALLIHPVALICFGLGVPLYLLTRAGSEDAQPLGRAVVRVFAVFALGGALAAYWILPFSAKGAWMAKYGELWKSLPEMAEGLWRGTLFKNMAPPIVWLGLTGALVAWRRRQAAAIFLLAWMAVLLFAASSTAFERFDLLSLSPSFGQVQFQRLSIPAKVCLFLLAGYALQALLARAESLRANATAETPRVNAWRWTLLSAVAIAAITPFIVPVAQVGGRDYGAELGRPKTRRDMPDWGNYQRFLSWSRGLRARQPGFFRIAYVAPYNDHFFAAAPIYNGLPAYKVGFTPCTNFIHKPDDADPALYRALSVAYVVTRHASPGPRTTLVKRFGSIAVYRFEDYSPQRYTLEGAGKVAVQDFAPDRGQMVLRLSGTQPGSRLILHVANYPNWRATTASGESLPITTAALGKHDIFLSVPARDGTVRFRYVWPAVNVIGAVASWLALIVCLLLASERLRRPLMARFGSAWLRAWSAIERRGVVLGLIVLAVGAAVPVARGIARSGGQQPSLLDRLAQARVDLLSAAGATKTSCSKVRVDRFKCSEHSWNYVGPTSERIGQELRRCIWAHPIDGGQLRITFPQVELGRALVGHHGLTDNAVSSFPGAAAVQLKIDVAGASPTVVTALNRVGWVPWRVDTEKLAGRRADITFTVSTTRAGGRHYCFDGFIERR